MNKKIVMMLLVALFIIAGVSCQGLKELPPAPAAAAPVVVAEPVAPAPAAAPVEEVKAVEPAAPVKAESPYKVVVNKALVEKVPASLEEVVATKNFGEVIVAAQLKDALAAIAPMFVKTARYAAEPASVVEAVVLKEYIFGIVPAGTEVPEGYVAF